MLPGAMDWGCIMGAGASLPSIRAITVTVRASLASGSSK